MKDWTSESLCRELRTNLQWCTRQIEWLLSKDYIEAGRDKENYHYKQSNPDAVAIKALEKAYAERRIAVTSLISYRLAGIKEFADAFLFRKDSKENKDG